MSDKYIIKNCNVLYFNPDKTAICNDLMLECPIECKERTDCLSKQIVENLRQVAYACHCDNCDGCGYYSGCGDTKCGTHQALKSLELLDIQECE